MKATDLSVHSQAYLNKWRVSSTNDHVRPCNLKPQQRDLTPVLRRPVEPAAQNGHGAMSDLSPLCAPQSGHGLPRQTGYEKTPPPSTGCKFGSAYGGLAEP